MGRPLSEDSSALSQAAGSGFMMGGSRRSGRADRRISVRVIDSGENQRGRVQRQQAQRRTLVAAGGMRARSYGEGVQQSNNARDGMARGISRQRGKGRRGVARQIDFWGAA